MGEQKEPAGSSRSRSREEGPRRKRAAAAGKRRKQQEATEMDVAKKVLVDRDHVLGVLLVFQVFRCWCCCSHVGCFVSCVRDLHV